MKLLLKKTKPGNLPYVSLYHGTHLYNFIIDTGSTCNWIEAKTLGNFLQEGETRIDSRTVNGEKCKVLHATLRVERRKYTEEDDTAFKFGAAFCSGELNNLEELNNHTKQRIHGILGMEFLDENCVSINLKNYNLTA